MDSVVIIVLQTKKQDGKLRILSSIRDQRPKKQRNKGSSECLQMSSGHLIPNSVYITKKKLGIKCPLAYLQV